MDAFSQTPQLTTLRWNWVTLLSLGRVSNLPTVWTNTLVALFLIDASISVYTTLLLVLSMSAAYTAGMFLNDAYDHEYDKIYCQYRPIPAGKIDVVTVHMIGLGLLFFTLLTLWISKQTEADGSLLVVASSFLIFTIVIYNLWHKQNPVSPVIMGGCRALVFITVATAVSSTLPPLLLSASALSFCYVIGLTYAAKQENRKVIGTSWPYAFLFAPIVATLIYSSLDSAVFAGAVAVTTWVMYSLKMLYNKQTNSIGKTIARLIAGISLVDGLFVLSTMAKTGYSTMGVLLLAFCLLAFATTLASQKYIDGT